MSTDLERVTGVLWEHTQAEGACTCGWVGASFPFSPYALQLHQAEALAAAGLIVTGVEWGARLPEFGVAPLPNEDAARQVAEREADVSVAQRGVAEWRTL